MRSFTIALILAICAPYAIVQCQSDDGFFFYWFKPTAESEPDYESYETRSEERQNQDTVQDVFLDHLPYDDQFDSDQFDSDQFHGDQFDSDQSAPVQYETSYVNTEETPFDTKTTDVIEEVASKSESSTKSSSISSDQQRYQDFINNEFMRRFKWLLENSSSDREVEEQPDKSVLNKNKSKKYIPTDMKKSSQIEKVESTPKSVAESENENSRSSLAESNTQQISSRKSSEKDSTSTASSYESLYDIYEKNSHESPEKSNSYEDSSFKNLKDDYSENISPTHVDANPEMSVIISSESSEYPSSDWSSSLEEPFLVPLEPYPAEYDVDDDSHITEPSDKEMPTKTDECEVTCEDKNISELTLTTSTTGTKEEDFSSVATGKESAEKSTKVDQPIESTSVSSIERSSVSGINNDNSENQSNSKMSALSTRSSIKEENFEKSVSTTAGDDKAVERISTESIKQDKAESTNQEYNGGSISYNEIDVDNEIDNKADAKADAGADDDKPLGHLSFGQLIKALIKCLPLV